MGQGVKEDSMQDDEEAIEEEICTGEHESPLINAKTKAAAQFGKARAL